QDHVHGRTYWCGCTLVFTSIICGLGNYGCGHVPPRAVSQPGAAGDRGHWNRAVNATDPLVRCMVALKRLEEDANGDLLYTFPSLPNLFHDLGKRKKPSLKSPLNNTAGYSYRLSQRGPDRCAACISEASVEVPSARGARPGRCAASRGSGLSSRYGQCP